MRHLLPMITAMLAMLATGAAAQVPTNSPAGVQDRRELFGIESIRLWPDRAAGAGSDDQDEVPFLTLFRPQPGKAHGTAVIVAPGAAMSAGRVSSKAGRWPTG